MCVTIPHRDGNTWECVCSQCEEVEETVGGRYNMQRAQRLASCREQESVSERKEKPHPGYCGELVRIY